jgi:hypothetical protein
MYQCHLLYLALWVVSLTGLIINKENGRHLGVKGSTASVTCLSVLANGLSDKSSNGTLFSIRFIEQKEDTACVFVAK